MQTSRNKNHTHEVDMQGIDEKEDDKSLSSKENSEREDEQDVEELQLKLNGERILRRRKSLPVINENTLSADIPSQVTTKQLANRNGLLLQQRRIVQRAISNSQVLYVMIRAAISEDSRAELQGLLRRKNANVNQTEPDGLAAIHYAAMNGTRETVEILINEGAKFNLMSKDGEYPLDIAVRTGNYDVAQFLIEKGARLDHVINGTPLEQESRQRNRMRNRAHTIDIPTQEVFHCDA